LLLGQNASISNISLPEGESLRKTIVFKHQKPKFKAAKTLKVNTKFSTVYGALNNPTTLPGLTSPAKSDFQID